MMTKIVHRAKHLHPDGSVSPLCATSTRAINTRRASWTLRDDAVTCKRCLSCLKTKRRVGVNVIDQVELDRAATLSRLVAAAVAAGVSRAEAIEAIYPDVYPEAPHKTQAHEARS